jgi:hypothetical protein
VGRANKKAPVELRARRKRDNPGPFKILLFTYLVEIKKPIKQDRRV